MKMKNILNSLFPWLAVTTLLSLQGCENEEGTAIHSRDTVSFEIDAGGARATETTFETGDAIGVYAAVRMSSAPATLKNVRKLCGQQAVRLERLAVRGGRGRQRNSRRP